MSYRLNSLKGAIWGLLLRGIVDRIGSPPNDLGGCLGGCISHHSDTNVEDFLLLQASRVASSLFTIFLQDMVVSIHKEAAIWTHKHYNPDYGDP